MNADKTLQSGTLGARNIVISWCLVLLWMLLIFFLSAQSALGGMEWPPILMAFRKSGHIVEYSVLGLLLGRALLTTWRARNGSETPPRTLLVRAWWLGVALATLYASTDEFHQSFVPQRGAHIADVLVDVLSATAALGVWYIMQTGRRGTMDDGR